MKLILLGTGAVRTDLEHWGPSQLVQVGGKNLLFDCGRGASMRLTEAGILLESIETVFFTHHHMDHNCDFAYFFVTSWLMGRQDPLEIIGPRGTQHFATSLIEGAYRDDIASRRGHPLYSEHGHEFKAVDVTDKEWVREAEGFTIRAIHPIHKTPILDNLAYRIEADGKSLVVAGDNCVCENLQDLAEGVDCLVHECSFPTEMIKKEKWGPFHTPPRELGKWARERGVKKLVLKHYCLRPGVVEKEPLVAEVRETFGDEGLVCGHDLMEIEI